jgi:hypothetical protein
MPHALQFLVLTVAGWVNRHQEDLIDWLIVGDYNRMKPRRREGCCVQSHPQM